MPFLESVIFFRTVALSYVENNVDLWEVAKQCLIYSKILLTSYKKTVGYVCESGECMNFQKVLVKLKLIFYNTVVEKNSGIHEKYVSCIATKLFLYS